MAGFQTSINRGIGTLAGVATAAQKFGAGQSGASSEAKAGQNATIEKYRQAAKEARDRYEWEAIRREHFEKKSEELTRQTEEESQTQKRKVEAIRRRFAILYGGEDSGNP